MNNLSLTACSIWLREKKPDKKNNAKIIKLKNTRKKERIYRFL